MRLCRYILSLLALGIVLFGEAEAQNLRDSFGHPYMIEVVNLQDGVQGSRPDEGYRTVAFEVVIENTSGETEDYNFNCFKIKTPRGYVIGAGPEYETGPALTYGSLAPGDKARGWLSVEVPEDASFEDLRLTCERVLETDIWKDLTPSNSGAGVSGEEQALMQKLRRQLGAEEIIGGEEMVYDDDNSFRMFILYREDDGSVGAAVYNTTEGGIRGMPLRFRSLDGLSEILFTRAQAGGILVHIEFDSENGLDAEYFWNLDQSEVHFKEVTTGGEVRYSGNATDDESFAEMADIPLSMLE